MKILFLDQNKWIDLARVHSGKLTFGPLYDVYHHLLHCLNNGDLLVPLTSANIIETSKQNDFSRRSNLARVQAEFSKGLVFRSRKSRILIEIKNALRLAFGHNLAVLEPTWVIVPNFIRAFEEYEPSVVAITELTEKYIGAKEAYLDFMLDQDDQTRRAGHVSFSHGSDSLVERIEKRRKEFANHSKELRQRAYAAQLFIDHQDLVIRELINLGHTLQEMEKLGPGVFMKFIEDIPTLNVELKLAISREAQTGSLKANDLGDIENFYTSIPYATTIVAEKNFVNLAKQTKLDKKYGVKLYTGLEELLSLK